MSDFICWYIVRQNLQSNNWIAYPVSNPLIDSNKESKLTFESKSALIPICKFVPSFMVPWILKWKINNLFKPCHEIKNKNEKEK